MWICLKCKTAIGFFIARLDHTVSPSHALYYANYSSSHYNAMQETVPRSFLWILCALECNCNGVHCSKEPRVKGGIVDKEALTKVCYTEQLDREVVSSRTASNQNRR